VSAPNVGFAGLGAMGAHMARNIHARGLLRAVHNRSAAKAEVLAGELGVHLLHLDANDLEPGILEALEHPPREPAHHSVRLQ